MILARLWIVQHEFTISEFGAFHRGRTDDAKSSPALIDALMMTLNWVRTILYISSTPAGTGAGGCLTAKKGA